MLTWTQLIIYFEAGMEEDTEYRPEHSRITPEALVRIEKAKLYQLILQNDLFGEDAGDEEAIAEVNEEIQAFVLARLETLMGMRSGNDSIMPVAAKLPWSQKQIDALTDLANRLLLKDTQQPMVQTPPKPTVNTIRKASTPVKPAPQTAPIPVEKSIPAIPKPTVKPKTKTTTKPLIDSPVQSKDQLSTEQPTEIKIGDERAYAKNIDNPLRKPMPNSQQLEMLVMSQLTGQDAQSVHIGSGYQDATEQGQASLKVRQMVLADARSAGVSTVQKGVD